MKVWVMLFALVMMFAPGQARADISMFILESVGVAGEFTGSGHAAIYFENICADETVRLRLCEPGEQGAVISSYPSLGGNLSQEWIAIPLIPYLYGVEDPENIPLYANGKVREFLRDNYRKRHLRSIIPDGPGGATPEGRWQAMLSMAFNRDIYSFNVKSSREEDARFLEEFNKLPMKAKFNTFSQNCADFVKKVMNTYFPGSTKRDFINDFGIATPKALAKSFTGFARSRPQRMFHITKYSQVTGTIWRSHDNRNFTEKAITSKKYIIPSLVFYPPVFAAFAGAYLLTGRYDVHRTYKKYPSAEFARLKMAERTQKKARKQNPDAVAALREIAKNKEAEKLRLLGNKQTWNQYKVWFNTILNAAIQQRIFQDQKEVQTFFKDLELMSTPALDDNGAPILRVRYYGRERVLGITRNNIADATTDRELAYKLMLAKIYTELNAKEKNRTSLEEFRSDWELMGQLVLNDTRRGEAFQMRTNRGRLVTSRPSPSAGSTLTKTVIAITQ